MENVFQDSMIPTIESGAAEAIGVYQNDLSSHGKSMWLTGNIVAGGQDKGIQLGHDVLYVFWFAIKDGKSMIFVSNRGDHRLSGWAAISGGEKWGKGPAPNSIYVCKSDWEQLVAMWAFYMGKKK